MMKKLITMITLMLCSIMSYGQTFTSQMDSGQTFTSQMDSVNVKTTEIITVDSTIKKSTLFGNGLTFFAKEFKSANSVIQMKDEETGKIIGKGTVNGRPITITLICKDGKYNIDIQPDLSSITKFGMYNGKTIYQYDNILFVWSNGYNWPNVYLNGKGTPLGMKNAYNEWKKSVDNILINRKSDIELLKIISDLKLIMLEKSEF